MSLGAPLGTQQNSSKQGSKKEASPRWAVLAIEDIDILRHYILAPTFPLI